MPPAETATRVPLPVLPAVIHGWGGGAGAAVSVTTPSDVEGMRAAVTGAGERGLIARGMGRSYGDAAQLEGGLVVQTNRLKRLAGPDADGIVTAEAGLTIADLLRILVPLGWMVPVVPGTQHVTVGGAIASDIHGKNHGTAGTFGSHVEALGLITAAGEILELTREDPLFGATLGGMGLTGVIVWARIRLRAVSSPFVSVDTDRVEDLDAALEALSAPGGPHRVAWLDLLGRRPGRGVVTRAEHLERQAVPAGARGAATVRTRATVPARWPAGVLRAGPVALFNELRFRRSPKHQRGHVESIGGHMFPLDALGAWPRLYGPAGFVQYQLVVPPGAERTLQHVIETLRSARVPCYLAVLKDFGPANDAPLSFPLRGWTLALDLPRGADGLEPALRRCDELVAETGGRVYLTKDARLAPETVRAMYPRLEEWQQIRDQADPERRFGSDLALRTRLVGR